MRKEALDAELEYSVCEDRIEDIRHLMSAIDDDMPEDETERQKESALGQVYDLLFKAELMLMGRMNELEEDYCARWEKAYGFSTLYRKEAELARENGVNFVALWEYVHGAESKAEAIRYMKEHGLASLNYEATCAAIEEYERDRRMRWTA